MTDLNSSTLSNANDNVVIPPYDRDETLSGVVHFGLGGFSRAHLAMYLDRALSAGGERGWGVCGVGLMPGDARMRDVLAAQDRLYTLVTRSPDGATDARVIGSVAEYLYAPDSPEAVIEKLASPEVRIVSLTVTEAGYGVDDVTGRFDLDRAGARSDAVAGAVPTTVWGFLVAGLARRRERGIPPFTVLSCDNIQGNGAVAREALVGFARVAAPGLADWIATEVAFPNSMVDRITPATTSADIDAVEEITGLRDAWPVCAEEFAQWVIEDRFPAGRPALETVGAQFVADVAPYEKMKLRLLNASHQAMSYLGLLAGFTYVHDVVDDPDFAAFLGAYMREEAEPTLDPVPGIDLAAYRAQLLARFSNRAIQDTLARQVVDGSDRIPKFLVPVIEDRLATGGSLARCALVLAAWQACLARGAEDERQRLITHDIRLPLLEAAAVADEADPGAFLTHVPTLGVDDPRLREAYLAARALLSERGPRGAAIALT
ncbi:MULTISPECIES: mannitol dehydrogenase family protein [Microbacterium]|uniref:Mannitol-1-phosphate 5-dehydrogenase n=1 Tax=Microbacterium wangchenii TaxID=2541726 RepID=A0ABX5SVE5_9MICO|nr:MULTISPECIES: mannitol dehydrogenase family protein [Microbacterium]MCK6065852.1 mannitol dehydrogenase family protein [Microbacterium sp. EYE_512]QBR90158.1 mannitol dehydrogenase family protein [Microbacterium wangchenii]TXK11826.1 mannitol dehydrogenase family protein [Microbacterium wangchenii]